MLDPFVHCQDSLNALDPSLSLRREIPINRLFDIKAKLQIFQKKYPSVNAYDASQGDGGASLDTFPKWLFNRAHAIQLEYGTSYPPPLGWPRFRTAVADSYWKLDTDSHGWGYDNVVAVTGGRDGLLRAYNAITHIMGRTGDFLLTTAVPWVSYTWGAYVSGLNVMLAPGDALTSWSIDKDAIDRCFRKAHQYENRTIAALMITSPDNPTGTTMNLESQIQLARTAMQRGVQIVIFDWIYHQLMEQPYDANDLLTAFTFEERKHIIILDGITKSLGASCIRNAHLLVPQHIAKYMRARASHGIIPSLYSQAVATVAYELGYKEVAEPTVTAIRRSRNALTYILNKERIPYIIGEGYYAFLHFPGLRNITVEQLVIRIAEEYGVVVVPGNYFSAFASQWVRFSYALPEGDVLLAIKRFLQGVRTICSIL